MQASISLLCLPCAGASATMYLRWRRLLPRWIEVVAVELPGRGSRMGEAFVDDFDAMVERLCVEQAKVMRGSFVLAGHSMGALLAYGMARHLSESGSPLPCAVVASGSAAPSRRDMARFSHHGDREGLIADLRKQGGTPKEVFDSPEFMQITLDVLAADYRVCESFRHVPGERLPMPLHAFGGRQDEIEPARLEAWAQETSGKFTLDWFDGGHFFIKQHETTVVPLIAQRLAQSVAGIASAPLTFA